MNSNPHIPEPHSAALCDLIAKFLAERNLLKPGEQARVHIEIDRKPSVVLTSGAAPMSHEARIAMLAENPCVSFEAFARGKGYDSFYSTRICNTFDNANLDTVMRVAERSEAEMLRYRNYGRKCHRVATEWLESLGLRFRMTFDEREESAVSDLKARQK